MDSKNLAGHGETRAARRMSQDGIGGWPMSAVSAPSTPLLPGGNGRSKSVYFGRRWVSLIVAALSLISAWQSVPRLRGMLLSWPATPEARGEALGHALTLGIIPFVAAVALINVAFGFPRLVLTSHGLTRRSLSRKRMAGWDSLSQFHTDLLKNGRIVSAHADVIGPNASRKLRRGKAKLFKIRRTYRTPIETILAEIHDRQTEALGGLAPLPRAASAPPIREYGIAGSRIPWMTLGLLAILVAAFAGEHRLGVVPEILPLTPDRLTLYAFGGVNRASVLGHGELLRLFSSTLLHLNEAHLVGNATALLLAGWSLERLAGRFWFLGIFMISGVAGSVAGLAFYPVLTLVGASGGIAGLFAAMAVLSFRLPAGRKRTFMIVRTTLVAIAMFLPSKATGGMTVGHAAHLGGALAGAALGILLLSTWRESCRLPKLRRTGFAVGAGGLTLALLGIPTSLRLSQGIVSSVQSCTGNNSDISVQSCTTLLDSGPDYRFVALLNRGKAYLLKGDYDLAVVDLDGVLALAPGFPEAFLGRGAAHFGKGRYDKSIVDFNKAIELNPKFAAAYVERGLAFLRQGLAERARADEDQAIALDPKLAGAYLVRGMAFSRKGAADSAITDYSKAIALSQDNADAYFHRGAEHLRENRLDEAIADTTKAIELRPANATAYNNRAWAFHLKGEDALGLPDAEKAVTLAPSNAPALETRAEIYEKLRRRRDAVADYRAALAIDAYLQLARDGLSRLGADPWGSQ